jgi:hypothetical protein
MSKFDEIWVTLDYFYNDKVWYLDLGLVFTLGYFHNNSGG